MKHLAVCAAVLALGAPAAAVAGPFEVTTSVMTSPVGLDLTTGQGANVMLGRLDKAVLKVCGASGFSLAEYRDAVRRSACYRDSLAAAVADLNAPTVTALFRARAAG